MVAVDEEGTEAAAATVVCATFGCAAVQLTSLVKLFGIVVRDRALISERHRLIKRLVLNRLLAVEGLETGILVVSVLGGSGAEVLTLISCSPRRE